MANFLNLFKMHGKEMSNESLCIRWLWHLHLPTTLLLLVQGRDVRFVGKLPSRRNTDNELERGYRTQIWPTNTLCVHGKKLRKSINWIEKSATKQDSVHVDVEAKKVLNFSMVKVIILLCSFGHTSHFF